MAILPQWAVENEPKLDEEFFAVTLANLAVD